MPVVRAQQIQTIRIGKSHRIAICCGENRNHLGTFPNGLPAELHVGWRNSGGVLNGRFKAE
jgi:hypothetical protein